MRVAVALILILVALDLSGCGKRARRLDPPDGTTDQFPKRYPPPDSSGTHL